MEAMAKRRKIVSGPLLAFLIVLILIIVYDRVPSVHKALDDLMDAVGDMVSDTLGDVGKRIRDVATQALHGATDAVKHTLIDPVMHAGEAIADAAKSLTVGERVALLAPLALSIVIGFLPIAKAYKIFAVLALLATDAGIAVGAFHPLITPPEDSDGGTGGTPGPGTGGGAGNGSGGSSSPPKSPHWQEIQPSSPTPVVDTPLGPNTPTPGLSEASAEPSQICARHGGISRVYVESGQAWQTAPYLGCRCRDDYFTTKGVFKKRDGYRLVP